MRTVTRGKCIESVMSEDWDVCRECDVLDNESLLHVEAEPVRSRAPRALPVGGAIIVEHASTAMTVAGHLHLLPAVVSLSHAESTT